MAEKPKETLEMAPDPEEDDLDDLDGKQQPVSHNPVNTTDHHPQMSSTNSTPNPNRPPNPPA